MGAGSVRTVTGDVSPASLGATNYHEHLFQVSPLLPGDELDDEDRSRAEAQSLRQSGFQAMVDATPLGLGRSPAAIARISAATGVSVVMTTGVHRREHYRRDDPLLVASEDSLCAAFVRDLSRGAREGVGVPGPDPETIQEEPRAGLMKVGIGYWSIDPLARRVITAIGRAHDATGAPVMVHLEHGSAAFEVLDLLTGCGVPPSAVALAHIDRNPDPGLHSELADAGVYLGYDGFARHRLWPDSTLLDCMTKVAGSGHDDKLLVGGDVARRSRYLAYGGLPGLEYLGRRVIPQMRERLGPLADSILRENPARLLSWR